jgi:hypothetical protein
VTPGNFARKSARFHGKPGHDTRALDFGVRRIRRTARASTHDELAGHGDLSVLELTEQQNALGRCG